jgi:xyloglucan fucosyltransferase
VVVLGEDQDAYSAGGRVHVHQPSHKGRRKWGDKTHGGRALGEMYLLSTCDVVVTTGFSTFGYVAHWLGGVRPWIMPATSMDGGRSAS